MTQHNPRCPGVPHRPDDPLYRAAVERTEAERELALDVHGEQARALHRIVRAMHDGHCPLCGCLREASDFKIQGGGHKCPNCTFEITGDEEVLALREFAPHLKKSVDIFEEWRRRLTDDETPTLSSLKGLFKDDPIRREGCVDADRHNRMEDIVRRLADFDTPFLATELRALETLVQDAREVCGE